MKQFFYVLNIILLILTTTNLVSSSDNKINITDKQKDFAEKISKEHGHLKAEWENTYVFDVTIDPEFYGLLDKTKALKHAMLLALWGFGHTEKIICVKLRDPIQGEIAYKCVGHTPS